MTIVVVTVVKNDLSGLKMTAESVSIQTSKVDWIIVTPFDESSTYHFARSLEFSGLARKVIHDEELGIYQAMNFALCSISEREWVWYLNAGDEFAGPDTYNSVSKKVECTKNKWLYGSHLIANSSGRIIGIRPAPKNFTAEGQLFAKDYVSHQATVFKKEILTQVGGFDERYQVAADWDLIVKVSKISEGERIDLVMSIFKMGGYSTFNRQIGNRELFYLRRKHLRQNYTLRNTRWFIYRHVRNELILKMEQVFPSLLDTVRIIRMSFRNWNLK